MFSGPPLPLSPDFPVRQLLSLVGDRQRTGAWVHGAGAAHRLTITAQGHCSAVVIGEDLGELVQCCDRVVLRGGMGAFVVQATAILRWRALQVITDPPELPGPERLREIFPGAEIDSTGFKVPIESRSPEELLASCLARGIQVSKSRIVYSM
jgi:hypothetical protein